MERLEKQMQFIIEVDKVKNIFRQTYLADGNRKENDLQIQDQRTKRQQQVLRMILPLIQREFTTELP